MRSFPRINLQKGAVTCVFIDGLRFKIENLCPSTTILRFHFFLWSKPLKIDQKKKKFPFAPFKRRPVKGQHFDSIGWGTDKSSHCWNQTKTSDCYWHFNASLIIHQSIRNENGASAWFAMKFGPLVMTSWPNQIQMISKWIWRLLKLSVHLKLVASFCAE